MLTWGWTSDIVTLFYLFSVWNARKIFYFYICKVCPRCMKWCNSLDGVQKNSCSHRYTTWCLDFHSVQVDFFLRTKARHSILISIFVRNLFISLISSYLLFVELALVYRKSSNFFVNFCRIMTRINTLGLRCTSTGFTHGCFESLNAMWVRRRVDLASMRVHLFTSVEMSRAFFRNNCFYSFIHFSTMNNLGCGR